MIKKNTETKKKNSVVSKIISGVLSGFLILCVFAVFLTVVSARSSGKTPSIFGYSFNLVATGSMSPEIKKNDFVIAKKVSYNNIKPDDDIIFISDDPATAGLRIVHRVYEINADGSFTTYHLNDKTGGEYKQGIYIDNAPARRVEGKVLYVSGFLGKILSFLHSGRSLLFVIILAILTVVIVLQVVKICKTAKGDTKETKNDGDVGFEKGDSSKE